MDPTLIAQLSPAQWIVIALAAFMIGLSKTGLPGLGVLAIPLLAGILPARASTGFVLPMLIMADLFAVGYYRRKAEWPCLFRIIPWALAGIVIGWAIMGRISDRQLQVAIGIIILALLGLNNVLRRRGAALPSTAVLAVGVGLLGGIATMLANAAGPILIIYLVALRLPKQRFIGTAAWYFFLLNWIKVPFSAGLGLITPASLGVNLLMLPAISLGALAGIQLMHRIPQQWFTLAVELLAALAALRLILG